MAKVVWSSEKELEDFIYSKFEQSYNPINDEEVEWFGRQVDLGGYGIIDLMTIGFDPQGNLYINVFELKKETVTTKALGQVARYIQGLKRYIQGLKHYFQENAKHINIAIEGYVIAPSIDHSDDTVFLINMLDDIYVYTVDFDLDDGVAFNSMSSGWAKTSPDFSKFHTIHGISIIADSETRKVEYDDSKTKSLKESEREDKNTFDINK